MFPPLLRITQKRSPCIQGMVSVTQGLNESKQKVGHLFNLNLGTFPQIFQPQSTVTEYLQVSILSKKIVTCWSLTHIREHICVSLYADLVLTYSNIIFIVLETIFPYASSNSKCLGLRQIFWSIQIILLYHLRISSFFFLFLCFVGLSLPSACLILAHSQ